MLLKTISFVLIINILFLFSNGTQISDLNLTNVLLSVNSQLTELSSKQSKLIDTIVKKSDIKSLIAELEQLKIDGVNRESKIQYLTVELEQQKKNGVDKESDIKHLKSELEKQKKFEVDIQSLQADQERFRKLTNELLNPQNCAEAKFNRIIDILLTKFSSQPFPVACDAYTHGGGWTVILKRMDGSVNFYRNWTEYKKGFGDVDGEFFLGLDKIHALTADRRQELLVILEDGEGDKRFEKYEEFAIGNEDQQYELHTLGKANGNAGDSLSYHHGMKFSTFDRDNDPWAGNCPKACSGAWWYKQCHFSNLAGVYNDNQLDSGVIWQTFRGREYSLKRAVMMIRPINQF